MKNNKPIAFALFAIELTEIEAAKDAASIRWEKNYIFFS